MYSFGLILIVVTVLCFLVSIWARERQKSSLSSYSQREWYDAIEDNLLHLFRLFLNGTVMYWFVLSARYCFIYLK